MGKLHVGSAAVKRLLLGAGGAPGGTPPTFISSALDTLGSVATGDLVLLKLVNSAGAAGEAPSGWTRFATHLDGHGFGHALYSSLYAEGNAAANHTNFPVNLGYFATAVYRGSAPLSVLQVGAYDQTTSAEITAPALANPTGASSALLAFWSSRDNGNNMLTYAGMTSRLYVTNPPTYFALRILEELGVQSGTRSFSGITGSGFVDTVNMIEIG